MKEFRDRVAVVTGAASGIGRGLAERFAAEGMKVVLADVEQSALDQADAEMRERGATVLPVRTDVSKPEQMEQLAQQTLEAFGAVHIVCNNAGVGGPGGPVWEKTLADWQWVLGVNLWGVIHGIRVFLPIMLKQEDEGHIVNTASMAGLLSIPMLGIYNVTKHAVVTLSETLYMELQSTGSKIGVSVLCPGFVDTNITNSDRNRPSELRNEGGEPELTPQQQMTRQMMEGMLKAGMKPAAVADKVFEAVRDGKFYVLSHPDMKDGVRRRMERILEETNPSSPGLV
jgi:NAD(P)-dependent dehydrogenase (short-subunit alcohol dehydrogenase family)